MWIILLNLALKISYVEFLIDHSTIMEHLGGNGAASGVEVVLSYWQYCNPNPGFVIFDSSDLFGGCTQIAIIILSPPLPKWNDGIDNS
jgi:hypothetical protein